MRHCQKIQTQKVPVSQRLDWAWLTCSTHLVAEMQGIYPLFLRPVCLLHSDLLKSQ